MCSITPFGLSGPHKDYAAYELTVAHGGGWAWLSPGGSDRPELPPLKAAGHQADFQIATAAATATLAAYNMVLQTGLGEHIDFSGQAYIASLWTSAPRTTPIRSRSPPVWASERCTPGVSSRVRTV